MTIAAMSGLLTKPGDNRVEQTLGAIVADPVNIKEFGAKGDNSTDDSAAINAAIVSGCAVYFPAGTYRAYDDITYAGSMPPMFIGERADTTKIMDYRDATSRPLISHEDGYMDEAGGYPEEMDGTESGIGRGLVLQNIGLRSTVGEYSSCLEVTKLRHSQLTGCVFEFNFRGVTFSSSCFDSSVLHCTFGGRFFLDHTWAEDRDLAAMAWGLYGQGHINIVNLECSGAGTGLYLVGSGASVNGFRIEVNGTGMRLGGMGYAIDAAAASKLRSAHVSGGTMEANAIGLHISQLGASVVEGISIQGSPATESRLYDGEVGVLVDSMDDRCHVGDLEIGYHFTRGGIINNSTAALGPVSVTNQAGPMIGGQNSALNERAGIGSIYRLQSTMMWPGETQRYRTLTAFHDLVLPGLTGLDIRQPPVFARNLGGVVTPDSQATSVAVAFHGGISTGSVAFNGDPSVEANAESDLEAGTYTYATTVVSACGETPLYLPKTVEVDGVEEVVLSFHGTSQPVKRRIYRAGADGFYQGYWEQDGHSPFTDDGSREFDGLGSPPATGGIPSRAEDDANYQIIATPSWATTVHVSDKTTTGFTLNFGTAAPDGSQTVAWLLFRP